MTGPSELFHYKALLIPWQVDGLTALGKWGMGDLTGSTWHDGDTCNAIVDRGGDDWWPIHIRCAGYDSAEINKLATRAQAILDRQAVQSQVETGGVVYLNSLAFAASHNMDDFGRMLAFVTLANGDDLATFMINSGHGVPRSIHDQLRKFLALN
jgi:endonuclease YncB( thermonuclease family)